METTIFGPPGTGKTTRLINIVKQELENGTPAEHIAFVSFSRKAAEEARTRASAALGMDPKQMVWFRTLHSMAFQFSGMNVHQVMRGSDYAALGKLVGLEFGSNSSLTMSDGTLFNPGKSGDAYLSMIQMARVQGIELSDQFNRTADYNLHYQQARIVDNALKAYKSDTDKFDFVDMIENFIAEGQGPRIDVLIVDEAQDLVPLQWKMVLNVLRPLAKRIYYAGDDDQCIYAWMGVHVRDFLNASENKEILQQSYRIPAQVHDIAGRLVNRLAVRQEKVWQPATHQGTVVWHHDIMDVDIRTGEWLILARTNYIANQISTQLKESGYVFYREGSGWSVSPNILEAIEVWLELCKGKALSAQQLKTFEKQIKPNILPKSGRSVLRTLDPEHDYTLDDIIEKCSWPVSNQTPWYDIVRVSEKEQIYISSVRRAGERILTGKPRVKISTIHKAKGGEADNVLLLLDSTKAALESPDQDSEVRTFYVGITRAKKALHLVEPRTRNGFYL